MITVRTRVPFKIGPKSQIPAGYYVAWLFDETPCHQLFLNKRMHNRWFAAYIQNA